jgi:hypothetical protein
MIKQDRFLDLTENAGWTRAVLREEVAKLREKPDAAVADGGMVYKQGITGPVYKQGTGRPADEQASRTIKMYNVESKPISMANLPMQVTSTPAFSPESKAVLDAMEAKQHSPPAQPLRISLVPSDPAQINEGPLRAAVASLREREEQPHPPLDEKVIAAAESRDTLNTIRQELVVMEQRLAAVNAEAADHVRQARKLIERDLVATETKAPEPQAAQQRLLH